MKINENYFQRLLYDTDAIEAVATLSGFWSGRLDSGLKKLGLSDPEWKVQLILIYSGEVLNGGFTQYFLNRGLETLFDTCSALKEVELSECADLAEKAGNKFAKFESGKITEEECALSLQKYDVLAFRRLSVVDEALLRFLRKNEELLLVPERA
ncbi:hypothetical protein ROA7450_02253 [Roseovarius albus]|uniref:DNA mimic protein DMP19 C-terminal domain-containing protein n=1 Tax=Roseovarius albus TaxID=1247867 RepID=A0A1X6ZBF1_9RHOB|nr:DUF4375 domain-containing protein [Roseovarius albus]SLN46057.1 hypothetical protein ROA7450_02253 [Roseovarius albus]